LLAIIGLVVSYWIPAPVTTENELRITAEKANFERQGTLTVVGELETTEVSLSFSGGELRFDPARVLPKGRLGVFSIKAGGGATCRVRLSKVKPTLLAVRFEYYPPEADGTWTIGARRAGNATHLELETTRLKGAVIDGLEEFDLDFADCVAKTPSTARPSGKMRVAIPNKVSSLEWSFPESNPSAPPIRDMLIVLSGASTKGKLELRDGDLTNPTFLDVKTGSVVIDDKGNVKQLGERASYREDGRVDRIHGLQIAQAVEVRFSLRARDTLFDYVKNNPVYPLVGGVILWLVNNLVLKRALDAYKKSYGGREPEDAGS
jgi:hypothetical protein